MLYLVLDGDKRFPSWANNIKIPDEIYTSEELKTRIKRIFHRLIDCNQGHSLHLNDTLQWLIRNNENENSMYR